MPLYTTTIQARSPVDGQIKLYRGPHIPAESFEEAEEYCENNGLGYCWVDGILLYQVESEDYD